MPRQCKSHTSPLRVSSRLQSVRRASSIADCQRSYTTEVLSSEFWPRALPHGWIAQAGIPEPHSVSDVVDLHAEATRAGDCSHSGVWPHRGTNLQPRPSGFNFPAIPSLRKPQAWMRAP